MSEKTLTHKDLGRMLGVSETTIKSYRRKFPDCIPVANDGKPIRFTQEAGTVCLRIRELFSRGMAVPEVRARLEREFAWIEPLPEQADSPSEEAAAPVSLPSGPLEVELPDDYTQALSGLAKSMVNLTMKQDAILRKMDAIDSRLNQLGLTDARIPETAAVPEALAGWLERAEALLGRLEEASAAEHERGHEKRIRIRNAYGDVNEYTLETSDASSSAPISPEAEADAVLQEEGFIFDTEDDATLYAPSPAVGREPEAVQEPPRALLTMPLVIQSPDGEFLGVAGRTRGRFCINDLKAMLLNHYSGSERYSAHWQLTGNGWLMTLEQKESIDPYTLALLVEQTTTPRGNNVALIEHLTINGRDENPVEMYNFINRIYES